MTRIGPYSLILLFCLWAPAAWSHALLHSVVEEADAVTVSFYFPGDDRPWFEPYQVFAPDSDRPFQTGRINALGEVSFRADRPGTWRIRVATEDGHGAEARVHIDETGVSGRTVQGLSYAQRVFVGLGYLLGAFGLFMMWRTRKVGTGPRRDDEHAHS